MKYSFLHKTTTKMIFIYSADIITNTMSEFIGLGLYRGIVGAWGHLGALGNSAGGGGERAPKTPVYTPLYVKCTSD